MVDITPSRSYVVHLHPQMAYIARCVVDILQRESSINSSSNKVTIFLLFAPSFLDHINSHCIKYLSAVKLFDTLKEEFPYISFEYIQLELVSDYSNIVIPDGLQKLFTDSVLDSIYRDLTPGLSAFSYYKSSGLERARFVDDRTSYAMKLVSSFSNLFNALKPVAIYLSHSHYDHYIAPVIAALISTRVRVNIFHSGYFTCYRLTNRLYENISPTIALSQLIQPLQCIDDDVSKIFYGSKSHLLSVQRTHHLRSDASISDALL